MTRTAYRFKDTKESKIIIHLTEKWKGIMRKYCMPGSVKPRKTREERAS